MIINWCLQEDPNSWLGSSTASDPMDTWSAGSTAASKRTQFYVDPRYAMLHGRFVIRKMSWNQSLKWSLPTSHARRPKRVLLCYF